MWIKTFPTIKSGEIRSNTFFSHHRGRGQPTPSAPAPCQYGLLSCMRGGCETDRPSDWNCVVGYWIHPCIWEFSLEISLFLQGLVFFSVSSATIRSGYTFSLDIILVNFALKQYHPETRLLVLEEDSRENSHHEKLLCRATLDNAVLDCCLLGKILGRLHSKQHAVVSALWLQHEP